MAAEYGININVRTKDEQLKRLQKELTSADRKVASLNKQLTDCLLYTSPSPRDVEESRMPSSA